MREPAIGVTDGQEALGHGHKVYRHFVASFPGLHSGKGVGGIFRTGFKIVDRSSVLEYPCYMISWRPGAGMKSPIVAYPHQLKKIVLRCGR